LKKILLLYFALFFICNILSISCGQVDDSQELEIYKHILQDYEIMEKIRPTGKIDFTSSQSRQFLLNGWSTLEKTHTWAQGLESSFLFFTSQIDDDKEMTITCSPFPIPGFPSQSLDIYLNGEYVKTLVLYPPPRDYKVSLPHQLLRLRNVITFRYKYAEKPSDHLPGSTDTRRLSVMFRNVSFGTNHDDSQYIFLKENRIFQNVGNFLNYYEKMPKNAKLKFHFESDKKETMQGHLLIKSPKHNQESQTLDKTGYYTIDLSNYHDKFTEISFSAKFNEIRKDKEYLGKDCYIKWSDIFIYKNKDKAEKSYPQNGDEVQTVKEQVRGLDVIYIVLDAFAARHSSAYGYYRKTSPTIDKLASQGILFENMFSPAPYTLAATASLFTSKYPFEHQVIKKDDKLDQAFMTIANKLSENGIATYCISSNPWVTESWGLTNGFDTIYYKPNFSPDYLIKEILPRIYSSKKAKTERKFLYIHIMPPHHPYLPPKRFRVYDENKSKKLDSTIGTLDLEKIDRSELKMSDEELEFLISQYDANILYSDEYIRRIIMYLKKKGKFDDTLLIVTSDHGEAFMEHGRLLHNSTVYDEMIHVPFVIKFPDSINMKNITVGKLASLIDVAPTLLDIMGLEKESEFRGSSLLPAIIENKEVRSLVYSGAEGVSISRTVRNTHYKYIYNPGAIDELYDLPKDPSERENIIHENPIIAGYYGQKLREIEKGTNVFKEGESKKVEFRTIDKEKMQQLRDLGYIR